MRAHFLMLPVFTAFSGKGGSSSLVANSLVYQAGQTALLPCDISVPRDNANARGGRDQLRLVMWYREDVKSPIYSVDARGGFHLGGGNSARNVGDVRGHWVDRDKFGPAKVVFDVSLGPERARLRISNVSEADDGIYR